MSESATNWVAKKIIEEKRLEIIERTPENFLTVQSSQNGYRFMIAVTGVQDVISLSDVEGLFIGANRPQFLVNIPTKTLWGGDAINRIHAEAAAFGKFGDIYRAASSENAGSFRDKNMGFFITAMEQHSNVANVSYIFDRVFKVNRIKGENLTIAIIDAYNMSSEDVRNARNLFGKFDIIVKSSGYGSVTNHAKDASQSMGAEAMDFAGLMSRLNR